MAPCCQRQSGDQRSQIEKGVAETCKEQETQVSKVDGFCMEEDYHLGGKEQFCK